jgi:ribosomal protein S12 methylthiotransferase accessory factor
VALSRALCEAAQSRLTRIAGSRDDIVSSHFRNVRSNEAADVARRQVAQATRTVRHFGEVPSRDFATFEEDLAWAAGQLASVGLDELVAVDLTKTADFAVSRVVIPGLESVSDAPGYQPGVRARRLLEELS